MLEPDLPSDSGEDSVAKPGVPAGAYAMLRRERQVVLEHQLAPILAEARPIVWELGCGHGHFLAAYAQAHPEPSCIGIDIAGDRIARAIRKRDRAKLAHLHYIRAESGLFLETLPAAARFADVYILFPDPWPKARHHKHRVIQPEFLSRLAGRMGEGARLCFRTDYREYFDEARQLICDHPAWRLSDVPWPFEHETVFQSRAERYHSFVAQTRPPPA